MGKRAAVYCRISSDPRGEGLGVERQRQACIDLAERKGWTVSRTFIDNDISAYSGKRRPQYLALLDAIEGKDIDVIVAWHPDRLHRSPVELEGFIALLERTRVRVETVQAGHWDLSTASGRLMARQLGGVARFESEHKADRLRAALDQKAAAGKPHAGVTFGWTRLRDIETGEPRDVINPEQAEVIRSAARDVIAGESLRTITARINSQGVRSARGKGVWSKGMVRAVLLRDRNVGLRVHRGEIVGQGNWEPILDIATWEQLRAVLNDPQRRTSQSTAAKHLLSGIALCGVCGASMRVALNRGVPSYRCAATACVLRRQVDVDDLVTEVMLTRLARSDAADIFAAQVDPGRKQAAEEATVMRARLDTAADDYADGKIDSRQMQRISARLRPQIEAADARARVVDDSPLLTGLAGNHDARKVWEQLSLARRRAVVDALITVRVFRTQQGARYFDPERVEITWRQ